jgi:hypothetical protein
MQEPHDPATSLDERRARERRDSTATLKVTVLAAALDGRSDNVSEAGVFFTSSERLAVEVELEEGGVRTVRTGHLVRVQRMSADSTGYAIEFDR